MALKFIMLGLLKIPKAIKDEVIPILYAIPFCRFDCSNIRDTIITTDNFSEFVIDLMTEFLMSTHNPIYQHL